MIDEAKVRCDEHACSRRSRRVWLRLECGGRTKCSELTEDGGPLELSELGLVPEHGRVERGRKVV